MNETEQRFLKQVKMNSPVHEITAPQKEAEARVNISKYLRKPVDKFATFDNSDHQEIISQKPNNRFATGVPPKEGFSTEDFKKWSNRPKTGSS